MVRVSENGNGCECGDRQSNSQRELGYHDHSPFQAIVRIAIGMPLAKSSGSEAVHRPQNFL
jgi:hypothetical protein